MKLVRQFNLLVIVALIGIYNFAYYNEVSAISTTGNQKVLVLMIDFPDKPGQVQRTYFEDLMFGNKPTVAPLGSFADYYTEVSYGMLSITGQVNDSATNWYRLPQIYSYYTGSGSCNGGCAYPNNVVKMVEDAIMAADATVDFGQYDTDNDGLVDALFVVHAGCGAEFCGDGNIWSAKVDIDTPILTNDVNEAGQRVSINKFTTEPEYIVAPNDMTIGVFVHEFAHLYYLPDLYDRDYSSNGLGNWSLMAGG